MKVLEKIKEIISKKDSIQQKKQEIGMIEEGTEKEKKTDLDKVKTEATEVKPEVRVLLKKTWRQYERERKLFILSSLIYGLAFLLLSGVLITQKKIIVLTPPEIPHKLAISRADASDVYYREMALFLTQLVGNLSPNTVHYAIKVFSSYLDPSIYQLTVDKLSDVADVIEKNQTSTVFYPLKVGKVGDTWYVVGTTYKFSSSKGGKEAILSPKEVVTYEIKFKIRNYRLFVVGFKQSSGDTLRKAINEYKKKSR